MAKLPRPRQTRAAERRQAQDPKDWKLAGKGVKRLDTVDKTNGKMVYGMDVKLPGMLNAAIKDCPVFGGKLKSYDEAKVASMKGGQEVVRVGDSAVAVVADTWWHARSARCAADRLGRGRECQSLERVDREVAGEGLDPAQPAFVGNENGDVKAALPARRESRGGLTPILTKTTPAWSDERDGALHRRQMRGLDRNAERRSHFAAVIRLRSAAAKCEDLQNHAGRRFRPAGKDGLCATGGVASPSRCPERGKADLVREEDMAHGTYHPSRSASWSVPSTHDNT